MTIVLLGKPPGTRGVTKVSNIASELRELILSGEMRSGQRLKIDEVAGMLCVSHMPVRMAFLELEAEGILNIDPHRGATIRQVDHTFLRNLFDLHSAVEGMLVARYTEIADDSEVLRLKQRATAFEQAATLSDCRALLTANEAFHGHINCVVGNAEANRVLPQGRLLIYALRLRAGYQPSSLGTFISEHFAIVDAIVTKNAELASNLVRQHYEGSYNELISFL